MVNIKISGITEKEEDRYKEAADEVGLSLSEYLRKQIRTGERFWAASGRFDHGEFNRLIAGEEIQNDSSGSTQAESDVKNIIYRELSTTKATPVEELEDLVVEDLVLDALDELMDHGEVRFDPRERGYYKND